MLYPHKAKTGSCIKGTFFKPNFKFGNWLCLDVLFSKSCTFPTPLCCSDYKSIVLSDGIPAAKGVEGGMNGVKMSSFCHHYLHIWIRSPVNWTRAAEKKRGDLGSALPSAGRSIKKIVFGANESYQTFKDIFYGTSDSEFGFIFIVGLSSQITLSGI